MTKKAKARTRRRSRSIQRVFIIPDVHVPFEDKVAFRAMLKALRAFRPDHLVILGDFGDFYSVSRHIKSPARSMRFITEVNQVKARLKEVKSAAGSASCHFICGNHEDRLVKLISDKCKEVFDLITIPGVLGLDEIGFSYTAYRDHLILGKLCLTHDVGHAGQTAHRISLNKSGMSIGIGHTHRIGLVVEKQLMTGDTITGAAFGWLGDEAAMTEYMPKAKVKRFAVHGFGVAYLLPDGTPVITPVPIVDGQCVLEGELFDGRKRMAK